MDQRSNFVNQIHNEEKILLLLLQLILKYHQLVSASLIILSRSFQDLNNEGRNIQINGFNIYNDGIKLNNNILRSDTLSYSISNSIIGKKYTITLISINEIHESSLSDSLSIISVDLPYPATLTLSKKIQIIIMLSWVYY